MKILQIATQVPYPPTDGGKLSVFGITKYLSKRNHEIEFVSYCNKYPDSNVIKGLKEYCNPHFIEADTKNNIYKAAINLFSNLPYNASKYKTNQMAIFLEDFLKTRQFDVIHIDHLFLGWTVDIIRKYTNAPVILRAQNLEMNIMKRFAEAQRNPLLKNYALLQYKKFLKYEPETCAKFDKCIMISEKDKQELLKFKPGLNVTCIPAGIESRLLEIPKKEFIPYSLVHIGHIDWYPNYDGLLWFCENVLRAIIKDLPEIKLYIYGSGKTGNFKIPKGLEKNIIVKGFVDNIWIELQDKALAVVPLRIGGGIRIKILELLATGTNIISTTIGKEGIDITDNKEILIADDALSFKSKILNFFEGKYNWEKMSENSRSFIREFYTWEKVVADFEKEYLKILNTNSKSKKL